MSTGPEHGRGLRGSTAWALGALVLAACATDAPPTPTAEEALPGGYQIRLDSERSDPGQFSLEEEPTGIHIRTGPAGIAYDPTDTVSTGSFRAEATFVQYNAPVGYREAYGIFVGGRELQGPEQEYTYLLVRGTGDFLVKRRRSDVTEVLVDWTPHPAVGRVEAEGDEPTNTLTVEVEGDETRFVVNGTVVHTMPTAEVRPFGVQGLRANHRLDIRVQSWDVERGPDFTE